MRPTSFLLAVAVLCGCAGDPASTSAVRAVRRVAVLPVRNEAGRTYDRYAELLRRRLEVALAEKGCDVVPAPLFDSALLPYPGAVPKGLLLPPVVDTRKLHPLDGYLAATLTRDPAGPTVGCRASLRLYRMPDSAAGPRDAWAPVWSRELMVDGGVTGVEPDAERLCETLPGLAPARR